MKYLYDAMQLLKENIAPETIDAEMLAFGMPMGPIELMDTIGLDICLSVAKELSKESSSYNLLEQKVNAKKLGRKSGEGFYRYKNGKALKNKNVSHTALPIVDRLVNSMVTEARLCLDEKIVDNSDLLDAGMIFGTGFAPFRGGLLHYAEKNKL